MIFYAVLAAINLVCMVIASEVAKRKGLKPRFWFFCAALIGPLVFPILYFSHSKA